MREKIETVLTITLTLILVATLGYGAYWAYDALLGPWLDAPVEAALEPPRPTTYQVMPGDTLWSIAARYYPDKHTGEIVHDIRELNPGINPGALQVGQAVLIPEVK